MNARFGAGHEEHYVHVHTFLDSLMPGYHDTYKANLPSPGDDPQTTGLAKAKAMDELRIRLHYAIEDAKAADKDPDSPGVVPNFKGMRFRGLAVHAEPEKIPASGMKEHPVIPLAPASGRDGLEGRHFNIAVFSKPKAPAPPKPADPTEWLRAVPSLLEARSARPRPGRSLREWVDAVSGLC